MKDIGIIFMVALSLLQGCVSVKTDESLDSLYKVDSTGSIIWSKSYDLIGTTQFGYSFKNISIDQAATLNDSSIVVAFRSVAASIQGKSIDVSQLAIINQSGDLLESIEIPLYFIDLVTSNDAIYVLSLDVSTGIRQIRLARYDKDLSLAWEKFLPRNNNVYFPGRHPDSVHVTTLGNIVLTSSQYLPNTDSLGYSAPALFVSHTKYGADGSVLFTTDHRIETFKFDIPDYRKHFYIGASLDDRLYYLIKGVNRDITLHVLESNGNLLPPVTLNLNGISGDGVYSARFDNTGSIELWDEKNKLYATFDLLGNQLFIAAFEPFISAGNILHMSGAKKILYSFSSNVPYIAQYDSVWDFAPDWYFSPTLKELGHESNLGIAKNVDDGVLIYGYINL